MPSKQASPREGEGRSVAERMAREIIPKWTNASAANTMEYEKQCLGGVWGGWARQAALSRLCLTRLKEPGRQCLSRP